MNASILRSVLLAAIAGFVLAGPAAAAAPDGREIIVQLAEGSAGPPRVAQADRIRPEFPRDPRLLRAERGAAELASGRKLPDLTLFYRVHLASGADPARVLEGLRGRPDVETAYLAPRPAPSPTDLAPPTPDFTAGQGYQAAAPSGVDASFAWTLSGGRGHGVRLCDIEYNWFRAHEELNDVGSTVIGPPPLVPPGLNFLAETNHGTAVLGTVGADRNGYGVEGIASRARLLVAGQYTQSGGYSPAAAINLASAALAPGDVILLELQMFGGNSGSSLVPAEWNAAEWAAITNAVAGGRIVVEAAGNGGRDLSDVTEFNQAFHRSFRDSGAILVGAGDSLGNPMSFTNYCTTDSRMDVWAWGIGVTTTGYGDLFFPGSDSLQAYTAQFAGTSSASAIVAGCVASIQGIAMRTTGQALDPWSLRALLTSTGTPQAPSAKLIGVQPDLRAAASSLLGSAYQMPPLGIVFGTPGPNPVNPGAVLPVDLDGDGNLDLVFGYQDVLTLQGFVEIVRNLGGGGFGPSFGPIPVGIGLPWLASADFDGDGNPDVAASASTQVAVLFGDGFGGILSQIAVPLATAGSGIAAADVDLDGNADIIVSQTGSLSVLRGNGAGGFAFNGYFFPGKAWTDVRTPDMNGDGFPDFCLAGFPTSDILLNDGLGAPLGGSFSLAVPGFVLDAGDLDQDTVPDLAILDPGSSTLTAVLGDGTGQGAVSSSVAFGSPVTGAGIALADVNGDRMLDAVVAGVWDPTGLPGFGLLLGDGRGAFAPPAVNPTAGFLHGGIAAADLDGVPGPEPCAVISMGGPTADVELFLDPFHGAGTYCRPGGVRGLGGAAADVLLVNGQAGDADRVIRVAPWSPITVTVADPPAGPSGAPYVLYAVRGPVGFSDATLQPRGIGAVCFPTPLAGGALLPGTLVVASSLGQPTLIGVPLPRFAGSLSRSIQLAGGLPSGSRVTLQGLIRDAGSAAALAPTNALELEVW